MNGNSKGGLPRWITAEGTIDLAEWPIDGILKQAIDPESERFRSGCVLLGSMAAAGRLEAGLYLIGLLGYYASDLQRLEVIAGQLLGISPTSRPRTHSSQRSGASGVRIPLGDT
jgi:hypothetical protein